MAGMPKQADAQDAAPKPIPMPMTLVNAKPFSQSVDSLRASSNIEDRRGQGYYSDDDKKMIVDTALSELKRRKKEIDDLMAGADDKASIDMLSGMLKGKKP